MSARSMMPFQSGQIMTNPNNRHSTPPLQPEATAEKILQEAEMVLSVGRVLDDHLEGRLESIANDAALPRALRARALVTLCRSR